MNHLKTITHVCIKSSDLDRTLIKRGVDQGRQSWITDPSGVAFEFHQYTGKSAQLDPSNRDVEVAW